MALAEIPQADADGSIARFYRRVQEESGSAVVNYIWRHLATIDGAAEWCWDVAQASDTCATATALAEAADRLADTIAPSFPDAFGFDPLSTRILDSYNQNNASNLARVACLIAAVGAPNSLGDYANDAKPRSRPLSDHDLPPLPAFAAMPATARAALDQIAAAGPAANSGVPPSLWRHLSVTPGLLEGLAGPVSEILATPDFRSGWNEIRRMSELGIVVRGPAAPTRLNLTQAESSLRQFHRRIAEMTLIGRILRAADRTHQRKDSAAEPSAAPVPGEPGPQQLR